MKLFTAAVAASTILLGAVAVDAADQTAPVSESHAQADVTEVLGIRLATASRDIARDALKSASVPAQREDNRYWYDLYDASGLLQGADSLALGYSMATGKLGRVSYTFPAFMDSGKVKEVGEMVATKYGRPNRASGNVGLGPVKYTWMLSDGVVLTVSRGWPDTSVEMAYEIPAVARQMQKEQAENDRAEKESAAKRQSHNF